MNKNWLYCTTSFAIGSPKMFPRSTISTYTRMRHHIESCVHCIQQTSRISGFIVYIFDKKPPIRRRLWRLPHYLVIWLWRPSDRDHICLSNNYVITIAVRFWSLKWSQLVAKGYSENHILFKRDPPSTFFFARLIEMGWIAVVWW